MSVWALVGVGFAALLGLVVVLARAAGRAAIIKDIAARDAAAAKRIADAQANSPRTVDDLVDRLRKRGDL